MSAVLLLQLAIAPGVFIMTFIYLKDRYEREPAALLWKSFFYGVASVVVTLGLSSAIYPLVKIDPVSVSDQAISAFLLVALVEEFSKFIFIRGVLYQNENFNEPFDGIVYSVMVGMGFATLENIMYVLDGGFGVGFLRMFTAVPAHASFAVLMGFFLGKAKFGSNSLFYSGLALLSATLLHGAYDFFFFLNFVPGIWIGGVVSLVIGILLSRAAIRIHQQRSPFQQGTENF